MICNVHVREGYLVILEDHTEGILTLAAAFNLSFPQLSWATN